MLPAYEQMVKASHAFNLLDARHAVSVTERQRFILRVRTLARGVAEAYRASREALGFPLIKNAPAASRPMNAHDLLFELLHRGTAAAYAAEPVDCIDRGLLSGLTRRVYRTAMSRVSRRRGASPCGCRNWPSTSPTNKSNAADRRSRIAFDAQGAPTQAAAAFAKNCGVPVTELSS